MTMKKKVRTNNITCGLFMSNFFWYNLKDIPIFFKRFCFLLRHGYSPMAQWETFDWFICVMREILTFYKDERTGDMLIEDVPEEEWHDVNDELYDTLLSLLDEMDEEEYQRKGLEVNYSKMEYAKERFFRLFSKYFYDFWD